jgi:uncharacterized protein YcnI
MRRTIAIATAVAALAAPAAAQAHVTLQPKEVPAAGFARLDVRVPNERDDASTTKVEVKFPPGFASASIEPVPGWTAKVAMRKAAEPIEQHGEQVTEEVDTITWSGGRIAPGQFQDFGISVGTPDKPNTTLTFKALQAYSGGEVVRWIGPPDADNPAPQVRLTAAADEHGAAAGGADGGGATDMKATVAAAPATDGGDDGAPVWLAVLALAVGVLGLLAGVGGLMAARRRTT